MKLRVLVVTMMAGGMLVGCALQEVGAPIYSRTGDISTTAPVSMTGDTYTVQPGDTLYSIATRHGCNQTELLVLTVLAILHCSHQEQFFV